jgi:thiol-disulfide isomerase/thioredoxin
MTITLQLFNMLLNFLAILLRFFVTCFLISMSIFSFGQGDNGRSIIMTGSFESEKRGDSFEVSAGVLKYGLNTGRISRTVIIYNNGSFRIEFPDIKVPSILVFQINRWSGGKRLAAMTGLPFLVEPGDSIYIKNDGSKLQYFSRDKKVEIVKVLDSIRTNHYRARWGLSGAGLKPTKSEYQFMDSVTHLLTEYLSTRQSDLTVTSYNILKFNILVDNQISKNLYEQRLVNKDNHLKILGFYSFPDSTFPDVITIQNALAGYRDGIKAELTQMLARSPQFSPFITRYNVLVKLYYEMDSCIIPDKPFELEKYYRFLRSSFSGLLREKLVTDMVSYHIMKFADRNYVISDALSFIKTTDIRSVLTSLIAAKNGEAAYSFILPDLYRNMVRFDSLKGKVVVIDFWFTGCGPCVVMYNSLKKVEEYFSKDERIVFVSINADKDPAVWKKSVASGKYTNSLSKNIINVFAQDVSGFLKIPIIKFYGLQGCPALLLINAQGILQGPPIKSPDSDDGATLIKQLESLLGN